MKFDHKGTAITVTAKGKFSAKVGGVVIERASMEGIQREIDGNTKFTEFDAVRWERYGGRNGKLETYRIVGFKKNPRTGYNRRSFPFVWLDSTGKTYNTVIRNTPDNVAAMKAARKRELEIREIEERHQDELTALENAVVEESVPVPEVKPKADK